MTIITKLDMVLILCPCKRTCTCTCTVWYKAHMYMYIHAPVHVHMYMLVALCTCTCTVYQPQIRRILSVSSLKTFYIGSSVFTFFYHYHYINYLYPRTYRGLTCTTGGTSFRDNIRTLLDNEVCGQLTVHS